MPTNILMPALSPTMEKGNLAKWLKKEGDTIKSGDVIAEIETDKATMEVEAVEEGILAKILVPEGTADVPVNDVIGLMAGEGEDAKTVASAGVAQPAKKEAPAAQAPASTSESAPQGLKDERQPAKEPIAARAEEAKAALPDAPSGKNGRIFASPLARRIAKEGNLDLTQVNGSGPHGRIVQGDVKAALAGGPKPALAKAPGAPAPSAPPAAPAVPKQPGTPSDDAIKGMYAPGSFTEMPHDSMRKTIARRLVEAKATVPHYYLSLDCELDALLALREQINAAAPKDKDGKPVYKVSVNDFVIKALAMALMRVPDANVTWTENAMLRHSNADIAIAVALPGGLITPVIRKADTKTLSAIANEAKDLAARARARKLKPEEYQGGTSAVSNLGMYGIKFFSAVINPPQSSIFAIGAGEKRVVVKNNAPAVATVMTVTISADHRAMDGALGAELISAFKSLIESPMGMLV